ncbi:hypothetical protein OHA70_32025 [Kribbella sp. NBC_00382]|uniref:hypothetical protein n=1 Tax=Kribbella sp. NBC_00382 TaxID=2975967 RepID=UPI002E1FF553
MPAATRFESTTYYFSVKLKGGDNPAATKRPFDALRLAWHDYPGEWFEESPSSEEEANRRIDTFRSLLRSDVAILLVDGQKLLDYAGEEERYLKSLLTNFRQGVLRLKDDLLGDEDRLVEFPRIWIMALSKADLFPDWDIHSFRDLVIEKAASHIEGLRSTLNDLVDTPDALFGRRDFMLLSSAKFQLAAASPEPVEIDVTRRVGLDLILPVASVLPLERRVQWSERMEIPRKVLDTLADGAETLAAVLVGGKALGIDKLVAFLPKVGPLAGMAAIPVLTEAAKTGRLATQGDQRPGPRTPRLPDRDAHPVQAGPRPRRQEQTLHQEPQMSAHPPPESLIWATRSHTWGFRFLLNAGHPDPLPTYERAFANLQDDPTTYHRSAGKVALRFQDPLDRRDTAGRLIPHEFIISGPLADEINSVDDGLHKIWPLVAAAYAGVWNTKTLPSPTTLDFTTRADPPAS